MAGHRHASPDRFYRTAPSGRGETAFQVVIEQSDLHVVAERDLSAETAEILRRLRGELKAYILFHPEFLKSLEPVEVPAEAPEIVRRMADAARRCGVGPMAAVAGAVAQMVAEELAPRSGNLLVENGGDCFLLSDRERTVALLALPDSGARLGVRLGPKEFPVSLCSSSWTIGHSLSLGRGDLVTTRAGDAALADAAATALANLLTSERDVELVLRAAKKFEAVGLDGVFAQCGERLGAWGRMELVALEEG